MGAVETKLGNLAQRLLMPNEVPTHFAGGRHQSFPEAPPNSLLLLAHIELAVPDQQAACKFYVDGLGAGLLPESQKGELRVHAGVSQFHLHPCVDQQRLSQCWPGHIYCWVDDSKTTFEACQAVDPQTLQEVHNISDERAVDALVLHDPAGLNRFIVNPAPKGGLVDKMRSLGSPSAGRKTTNLLAIMDATHMIATGTGKALKRFYEHHLGVAMSQQRGGYSLHFSLGQFLQQTLTFVEDESVPPICQSEVGLHDVPGICIYMPTTYMFKHAFQRCSDAGLIVRGARSLQKAEEMSEFSFQQCLDPDTKEVVLELMHTVRVPTHAECPLPAGQVWRKESNHQESRNCMGSLSNRLTMEEVAMHRTKEDAWVVINGRVLDVTNWIGSHPWHIIFDSYGMDVSTEWNSIHPPGSWEEKLAFPRGPRMVGFLDGAINHDPLLGA